MHADNQVDYVERGDEAQAEATTMFFKNPAYVQDDDTAMKIDSLSLDNDEREFAVVVVFFLLFVVNIVRCHLLLF